MRNYLHELSDYLKPDELTRITDVSGTVVVTNLPRVDETKIERLKTVLVSKVFTKFGKFVENSLFMPFDENKMTSGYKIKIYILSSVLFITYIDRNDAKAAVTSMNGWDFDKSHKLNAFLLDQIRSVLGKKLLDKIPAMEEWPAYQNLKTIYEYNTIKI